MKNRIPTDFFDLADRYLSGDLAQSELSEFETLLLSSPELQELYLDYAENSHDLNLVINSQKQNELAMAGIRHGASGTLWTASSRFLARNRWQSGVIFAASVLLLIGGFLIYSRANSSQDQVAWLSNAQNCDWENGTRGFGNMKSNTLLKLRSGLAEIDFASGAKLILQGPAELKLLTTKSARLVSGQLTVRIPKTLTGFEIITPNGRVIDLGTEFGISIGDDKTTKVVVFEGEVEAFATTGAAAKVPVLLAAQQEATLETDQVIVSLPDQLGNNAFTRSIVAPPQIIASTKRFDFSKNQTAGIKDTNGKFIGLDTRLPGTGGDLLEHDENWVHDEKAGLLRLTTTRSDINRQTGMDTGEYLGVRLADYGFTGDEDFSVTATLDSIPLMEDVGQFGLYAGSKSDLNIRGGFLNWNVETSEFNKFFLVNDERGIDKDTHTVGLLSAGVHLRLILSRLSGKYSLRVENLSDGGQITLEIKHPEFLDGKSEMYVGLFGANPFSEARKRISIRDFSVTVWVPKTRLASK